MKDQEGRRCIANGEGWQEGTLVSRKESHAFKIHAITAYMNPTKYIQHTEPHFLLCQMIESDHMLLLSSQKS